MTTARGQKVPPSSFAPRHPSPTQDDVRSGVSVTLWCDCEDPSALRGLFIDFVTLPAAEADPAGWYEGLLGVEGSRKVLERFNRKSFSANRPGDPGQRVTTLHLPRALAPLRSPTASPCWGVPSSPGLQLKVQIRCHHHRGRPSDVSSLRVLCDSHPLPQLSTCAQVMSTELSRDLDCYALWSRRSHTSVPAQPAPGSVSPGAGEKRTGEGGRSEGGGESRGSAQPRSPLHVPGPRMSALAGWALSCPLHLPKRETGAPLRT